MNPGLQPLSHPWRNSRRKKEGKGSRRKQEADSAEPAPKKKKTKGTPSATLGRVPDAEAPLVPEVPQEAALVSMEQRSSMDKQLEAHLLRTDPLATVTQPSQTTSSSMVPQVLESGSFLTGLREFIAWGRA